MASSLGKYRKYAPRKDYLNRGVIGDSFNGLRNFEWSKVGRTFVTILNGKS